jgi:DNA-binding SARP family transcriptional activator
MKQADTAPGAVAAPALRLLGQVNWQQPDGCTLALGPERRHQLLALLGYRAAWMGRDDLAALFWPERPDRAARANLRKVIHELRRLQIVDLDEGPLGLRWVAASDVGAFRQARDGGDWQRAAALGAGVLMPGLDGLLGGTAFGDWLRLERERWNATWRDTALRAATHSDAAQAWSLAERLLASNALDEDAMAIALRAAAALERPELVKPLWRRHVAQLQAEQGISPATALSAMANGAATAAEAPLWPLVGRQRELAELTALLASGRLVTVLGAGGVGKTRLARQAAETIAPRFAAGAVFVALDDALAPQELPPRIASALGLSLGNTGDPVQALARALRTKSLLLLLDGFEAIIDAGPALLHLLAQAPALRILVTSRERLAVDGEWLLPLAGLDLPAPGASAGAAMQSQAVALFAARALAVNPAFDLAGAIGPVAEICRHLDGLPLALELAASWVRLLAAAEIAQELQRHSDLLDEGGAVDLDVVFERSWSLLTAAERDAQARLAVFRGGFTRTAACEIAGVGLATLAALVDKSMLTPRPDSRFEMHPLLLTRARRKLAAQTGAENARERHSRWFLALTQQPGALPTAEHDNLLAAWQHAIARRDGVALDAVLFTLPWSSIVRGQIDRAVALLGEAVAAFGSEQVTGAQLLAQQGWLLLWQERRQQAVALAQQALAKLRPAGDVGGTVMALRTLGHAARMDGQHALAAQFLAEGVDEAHRAGRVALEALMLDGLAMALNMLGRHAQARAAVEDAMALNGIGGDAVQRVYNFYNLAQSHSLAGAPALALPWAEQALALASQIGHGYFLPHVHVELAHIHAALRHFTAAHEQLALARPLAVAHHDLSALAAAHAAAAHLALAEAKVEPARQDIVTAARLCLERDNVVTGAALVLSAAQAHAPDARALRWLRQLLALAVVQEPVRRQALLALAANEGDAAPGAPPATLRALLTEVIAAG